MKLSFCTDSLGHLPFEPMLDRLLELGVRGVEMTTGGWSPAPIWMPTICWLTRPNAGSCSRRWPAAAWRSPRSMSPATRSIRASWGGAICDKPTIRWSWQACWG